MTVLICPDKFKGSLTARAAAEAISRGVSRALPKANIILQPLADGGEGSLELLAGTDAFHERRLSVSGPVGKAVDAAYLLGEGRAIIESARACGLNLVPRSQRHPRNTTTIGVGMLIEDAIARGAREITLLLGGSATNDGGAGMAAALGYRFFGHRGEDFVPTADSLRWVERIDDREKLVALTEIRVIAVVDVDNPLLGENGATYTYALQKGAKPEELKDLEDNMDHFSGVVEKWKGSGHHDEKGSGAAGGLGFGARAFLNAELRKGTEMIFEAVALKDKVAAADLVITGEGKIDAQTSYGKVVAGVAAYGKPTIAVCGRNEVTAGQLGVECILSIMDDPNISESTALLEASQLIEELIYRHLMTVESKPDDR